MRGILPIVVVAVATLLFLSGCAGSVEGPVIEGNRRTGGTDAEVGGVVVIEGSCIYLLQPEIDTRYPVVWPHGSSWNRDESAIELPNGILVHDGDRVYGGGGYHKEADLAEYTVPEGVELALSCLDNQFGEVAVFNSGGDIGVER
ncbi:MAG: hypothetical protein R2823_02720 [Acidimicrobiia bacterium]